MRVFSFLSRSADETEAIGFRLGEQLQGNELLLLTGDLGAGKTVFVKGVARALSIDPDEVFSPAFVIMQQFKGKFCFFHFDFYRLEKNAGSFEIEEFINEGVMAIEWANYLHPDTFIGCQLIDIHITVRDEERRITIASDLAYINL